MREKRRFIRTKLRRLTSIVKSPSGDYKLLVEQQKKNPTLVNVKDISTGGIRIETKYELIKGTSLELTMPKIKTLNSAVLKCEVTRAEFEEGNYEYAVGLKFIPTNTDYLKQFVEAIKA